MRSAFIGARRPHNAPVVLTRKETQLVLSEMQGAMGLAGRILYGAGLRLSETVRLRVKDIDFGNHQIIVGDGKGAKDRITMFPNCLQEPWFCEMQVSSPLLRIPGKSGHLYTLLTILSGGLERIQAGGGSEFVGPF